LRFWLRLVNVLLCYELIELNFGFWLCRST
jgi:hypothetical protein